MASCFRIRYNVSKRTARNDEDCTPKPVCKFGSLKCTSASSLLLKMGKSNPRFGKWISNDTYGTCGCEPDRHNSSQPSPTFWMTKGETPTTVTKPKHRHHKSSRKQVKDVASGRCAEDAGNAVTNNKTSLNSRSVQGSSGSVPRSRDSDKEDCITRQSTQSVSFSQSQNTGSDDSLDSVFESQNDFSQFPAHTSGWSNMNTDIYITPVQRTLPRCCPPKGVCVAGDTDKDIKILNKPEGLKQTLEPSFANIVNSPVIKLSVDSPPRPGLRAAPSDAECSPPQEDVDLNQLDLAALGKRISSLNSPRTVNDMNPDNVPPLHVHREEEVKILSREFQDCPKHRALDIPSLPPRHKHFPVQVSTPRPCITPYYVNFRGTLQSRNHLG
ncbi:uncharacterized protein LOC124266294 [Haliotis rubra]|uniref:uncharacterized protein LOC124266294 n=1 Tax=Haliotis rubra TaxID=36100 RepID=UPI001EE5DEC9|nr:uncharacterized protein LOC124266294 [Haliotis rubra]